MTSTLREINRAIRQERATEVTAKVYGIAGLAIGLCVLAVLTGTAHKPDNRTFELVAIHADGESDIVDYDLTRDDCLRALLADMGDSLTCQETTN